MFGIHAHLLPACNTYEGAVQIFEKAHQHARFEPWWRGLKDKRDTSKTIAKNVDGVIRFRYHHTDLVTWAPDELRVFTWDSRSSVDFADRFLPDGIRAVSKRGVMHLVQDGMYYTAGAGPIVFNKRDRGWVVDPRTVARHQNSVLDRTKAAHVRKTLKPYMDWNASIDRMIGASAFTRVLPQQIAWMLRAAFATGVIPVDQYQPLRESLATSSERFLKECYVLAGAVTKVEAPLGSLPKPDPYVSILGWFAI